MNGNMYSGASFQTHWQVRLQRNMEFEYNSNTNSGGSANWQNLTITSILNTNVRFIDNGGSNAIRQVSMNEMILIAIFASLMFLLVITLIKRR